MKIDSKTTFASAGLALACLIAPMRAASAAPDNTLGMATMAAAVNAFGDLLRGSGVVEVNKVGTGHYAVVFERNISTCFMSATLLGAGGSIYALIGSTVVAVHTLNSAGTDADQHFHLTVFCSK